jgi:hypothetical protein
MPCWLSRPELPLQALQLRRATLATCVPEARHSRNLRAGGTPLSQLACRRHATLASCVPETRHPRILRAGDTPPSHLACRRHATLASCVPETRHPRILRAGGDGRRGTGGTLSKRDVTPNALAINQCGRRRQRLHRPTADPQAQLMGQCAVTYPYDKPLGHPREVPAANPTRTPGPGAHRRWLGSKGSLLALCYRAGLGQAPVQAGGPRQPRRQGRRTAPATAGGRAVAAVRPKAWRPRVPYTRTPHAQHRPQHRRAADASS